MGKPGNPFRRKNSVPDGRSLKARAVAVYAWTLFVGIPLLITVVSGNLDLSTARLYIFLHLAVLVMLIIALLLGLYGGERASGLSSAITGGAMRLAVVLLVLLLLPVIPWLFTMVWSWFVSP